MFLKFAFTLLLCGVAYAAAAEQVEDYEGYKIYDINAKNDFEKGFLLRLAANEDFDFFNLPRAIGDAARVMVKPEDQSAFEQILSKINLDWQVINENYGASVKEERQRNAVRSVNRAVSTRVSFAKFLRFSEINAFLDELASKYPKRVSVKSVGKSYEGRDMKTITITNGDGRANKKVIFVDAGIHAREWIAPAGAVYIINELVENFAKNANLLKDYDWVVLPVVNPDGYEYSHTTSRMWRKTRKPVTSRCAGTDGNRNFGFHWGEVGASNNACDDTFKGQTAFSEVETKIVRDIMLSLTGRAKMYLTLHAYGNYLLYPWGYTSGLPSNVRDLDEVAQAGAAAIRAATGTRYTVGSSTNVLYAAAGGSDDYALAQAKIPISITMELPAGGSGFDPRPAQIQSFVSETWIGVKAMAEKVIAKF